MTRRVRLAVALLLGAGACVAVLFVVSGSFFPGDEVFDPPIHQAVEFLQYDRVRDLVSAGADVDARDQSGDTPLMAAAGIDDPMVDLLLSLGADPNAVQTGRGWSPLTYAVYRGSPTAVELLLGAGAREGDPPKRGRVEGMSLCEIAHFRGHESVASLVC